MTRRRDLTAALAAELSDEAFERICAEFGGARHYIRRPAATRRFLRDERIRALFTAGASYTDLARAFALTVRQVRRITAREKVTRPALTGTESAA